MQIFIESQVVQAEATTDSNGRQVYDVYYPDGRVRQVYPDDFELHFRLLDRRERQLIDMNTQELEVLSITDKDYLDEDRCPHDWAVNEETDRSYCLLCGADGDG